MRIHTAVIPEIQIGRATIRNCAELRQWLNSEVVIAPTELADWPTPETARMWSTFWNNFTPRATSVWSERSYSVPASWNAGSEPPPGGQAVRIYSDPESGDALVLFGRRNAARSP